MTQLDVLQLVDAQQKLLKEIISSVLIIINATGRQALWLKVSISITLGLTLFINGYKCKAHIYKYMHTSFRDNNQEINEPQIISTSLFSRTRNSKRYLKILPNGNKVKFRVFLVEVEYFFFPLKLFISTPTVISIPSENDHKQSIILPMLLICSQVISTTIFVSLLLPFNSSK